MREERQEENGKTKGGSWGRRAPDAQVDLGLWEARWLPVCSAWPAVAAVASRPPAAVAGTPAATHTHAHHKHQQQLQLQLPPSLSHSTP